MKLQPQAKPIKIRIMLGGEEHSTIEGVKRCFSMDELLILIGDGRFDRWLDQIGERDKAERIRTLRSDWDNNISEPLFQDIICILFGEQYSKDDLLSIVKSWETDHSFDIVSRNVLRFLSKKSFDAAKYYYIKDKDADEPWQEIFSNIKDLDILKDLYRDEQTRTALKETVWGVKFSSFVSHVDIFGHIFEFIEQTTCDADVLSSFCNSNERMSLNWIGNLDLKSIQAYYRNESIRPIFQKYWSILFSDFVKGDKSFEQILQWIQNENDAGLEVQFIKCCADKNIEKAKTKSTPISWYQLAHSKDYEIIKKVLDNYNLYSYFYKYKEKEIDYGVKDELTTPLAFQICDFLLQMKILREEYGVWGDMSYVRNDMTEDKFQPYFLTREKHILECSKKCQLKLIGEDLSRYDKEGCVLAKEVIEFYNNNVEYYSGAKEYPSLDVVQKLTLKAFKEQLENARK